MMKTRALKMMQTSMKKEVKRDGVDNTGLVWEARLRPGLEFGVFCGVFFPRSLGHCFGMLRALLGSLGVWHLL